MKRIIAVFLFAAAALNLYAELTIGGLIDMVIVPYQLILTDDTEPRNITEQEKEAVVMGAGAGRNASGQGPRFRLDIRASHEDLIGMRARIQARTDGIGIEDYLQAWWKPTDWLRVDAGRFLDDRLRGKINDLDERWNAYSVRMYDADSIFSRFRTHWTGQAGLMLSFTPIENLFVGALLYGLEPFSSAGSAGILYDAHPDYVNNNADAWQRIQAAVSYNIEGVGLARAQYLGAKPGVAINRVTDEWVDDNSTSFYSYAFDTFTITAPRIEAAFAYTGIPGLTIDIGGKFPLPFKNWDHGQDDIFTKEDETLLDPIYRTYKDGFIWQAPYQAALGLRFSLNALEIAGKVDAKFLGSMKGHKTEVWFGPEINAHIWPSYDLGFARIILNVGYEYIGPSYDEKKELIGKGSPVALNGGHRMGAGLSLQKDITSNCFVKGGVAYKHGTTVNGVQEKTVLTVPLHIEYSF